MDRKIKNFQLYQVSLEADINIMINPLAVVCYKISLRKFFELDVCRYERCMRNARWWEFYITAPDPECIPWLGAFATYLRAYIRVMPCGQVKEVDLISRDRVNSLINALGGS